MKKGKTVLLALFCTILWGMAAPLIKLGYEAFGIAAGDTGSILLFAGIRFVLAGIFVLITAICFLHAGPAGSRQFARAAFLLAIFQTAGQYFFYYLGLAQTSGVSASILTGTGAFFTLLVSVYCFRLEKMHWNKAAGCLLGFAGILFLNGNEIFQGQVWNTGAVFILAAQLCTAVSACLIQMFGQNSNPALLSGAQFTIGGLLLCLLSFLFHPAWKQFSVTGFLILLFLAFISAAAYTIWGYLLKYNPVSEVSIFDSFIPAAGVFLSALLLQEYQQALQWSTLAALLCILGGIWLVNLSSET